MQEAARAAGAGLKITKIPDFSNLSKNDLVLIEQNWLTPSETEAVLAHGSAVMAIEPGKELRETLENMKCDGIVFTGTHTVIAMPREATAKITYTCLLP